MSLNFLVLTSSCIFLQALESFYEKFDSEFIDIRTKAREVLQREDDLNEIVQVSSVIYAHLLLPLTIFGVLSFSDSRLLNLVQGSTLGK